jgi:thiamine-phosphate diphosphorylase
VRELKEETGLCGRVDRLIGMEMSPNPLYRAVLVMGFMAVAVSGELKAEDDALAAAYFSLYKLPELAFASHARIIAKAAAGAGAARPAVDLRLPWSAYVITSGDHLQLAREACRGGARVVQYRDKEASSARRLDIARQIRSVTREHGTLFMVNDQIDIAMLSEADGVHLGQEDITIADARSLLASGMIIGVSCSSLAQAQEAERQGADYIGIGAVFATPVKAEYSVVGLELLRQMVAEIAIPLVAIGGINLDNMAEVKAAGVRNVAMVREFQNDTAAKVAAVNSFFK